MTRSLTLDTCADALTTGRVSAHDLLERCFERIAESGEDASRIFIELNADDAYRAADEQDRLRRQGRAPSRFAGIPFSVKDIFDVQGQKTRSGSICREHIGPAQATAPAVQRLLSAGMIQVGRTNMTEFAYSGLGLNPHFGVPPNHWGAPGAFAPGGSSSGAASSVRMEMAIFGLGTDTGGSCRIPAAFQGLTGYKPTASSVSLAGVVPLSPSLDSVGPIAPTVRCCADIWRTLSGTPNRGSGPATKSESPTLFVPDNVVMTDSDTTVARDFETALSTLSRRGWTIRAGTLPFLEDIVALNARGGYPAYESYRLYGELVKNRGRDMDPRVASRILRGETLSDDYAEALGTLRKAAIQSFDQIFRDHDAVAFPTVAITPPLLSDLESDDAYFSINALVLRNTALVNFLDGCSISIPMHEPGSAPTGFMLSARSGDDQTLLHLAEDAEGILRSSKHNDLYTIT
jgi:aspartyl-tRNA(Asn)/glutamyl-tRNA(Gln) amidotransferase subunit A